MSGLTLQSFYNLFNMHSIELTAFPGIEYATHVSREFVVPEGSHKVLLRDGLLSYLFDRHRCLVVVTTLSDGQGYKYDLFTSIDPSGLFTKEVFAIMQTYTSAK